ncbi:MAG: NAD(P)/FAD-dependent oxidoreductase [Candidatus Omnitrophota bacterium]
MITQSEKIIIIGAGFAGLSAAYRLAGSNLAAEITVIDKKEHTDFLPLIPDCIGRGINLEFLTCSIVEICRKLKINFIKEEVVSVNFESKSVTTLLANYVYDYLIIASGSQANFFSNQAAQDYGYCLNSVTDVRRIIKALKTDDLKNLVICGGGYTGVEAATNLWLFTKKNSRSKRIVIVERAPAILGTLPVEMKTYVEKNLKSMGIEILTNTVIEKIQVNQVSLSTGQVFNQAMLIWVPGVKTAEFIQKLDILKNPQGRIIVDEYLRAGKNCFCCGDTAFFGDKDSFLRMAVQFAITQGDQAAKNIIRSIKNMPLKKYRILDLGYVIPMANNQSCGRVLGLNVSGYLATFLHFSMCIFRSVGWKNRRGLICNLLKGGGKC